MRRQLLSGLVLCSATLLCPQQGTTPQPPDVDTLTIGDDGALRYPTADHAWLQQAPLSEISEYLYDAYRAAATARYRHAAAARLRARLEAGPLPVEQPSCGGTINVLAQSAAMNAPEWEILATRLRMTMEHGTPDAAIEAMGVAESHLQQTGYHIDNPDAANAMAASLTIAVHRPETAVAAQAAATFNRFQFDSRNPAQHVDRLLRVLTQTAGRERLTAAMTLSELARKSGEGYAGSDERVVATVARLLEEPELEPRDLVGLLTVLGKAHGAPEGAGVLLDWTFEHGDNRQRRATLRCVQLGNPWELRDEALRRRGAAVSIPIIIKALNDPSADIRVSAATRARNFGPYALDALDPLLATLDNLDPIGTQIVIGALGEIGDRRALPRLRALATEDGETGDEAQRAIWMITREGAMPSWGERWSKQRDEVFGGGAGG